LPELPATACGKWSRLVDTSLPSPDDICLAAGNSVQGETYRAAPRSTVLLVWDAPKDLRVAST